MENEEINRVLSNPYKDVCDYLELCKKYPSEREFIKEWMLGDMKSNPCRYGREEMYRLMIKDGEILDEPLFSPQEIINSGVLSKEHVDIIRNAPSKWWDYFSEDMPKETFFDSEENNTDVFFFGFPASGKTSVLAGLLSASDLGNDDYFGIVSPSASTHKGYNYAMELVRTVDKHVFPRKTRKTYPKDFPSIGNSLGEIPCPEEYKEDIADDLFIQIIDAKISNRTTHSEEKFSLVEMSGESTLRFAVAKIDNMNKLGESTAKLFNNDNDKVVFFVIDPNDKSCCEVNINGSYFRVTQAQTLIMISDFLEDMVKKGKLKNLKSVHVIISKSDLIPLSDDSGQTISMKESIDNIMHRSKYKALVDSLMSLCSKKVGDVNKYCGRKPKIFTYSIGRILPGDMYDYDSKDAIKILEEIKTSIIDAHSFNLWKKFCNIANKKIF